MAAICTTAIAGLAHAEVIHWTQMTERTTSNGLDTSRGNTLTLDLSGYSSWDFQGDTDNEILSYYLGSANAEIWAFEVTYNLNLTTVGVSWADEMTLTFNDEYSYDPAAGDAFSVVNANYSGSIDPSLLGMTDAQGFMNIEFHEIGFDDNADAVDSYFEEGSYLRFTFPAPGTLGGMMLGLGIFHRRRRRS